MNNELPLLVDFFLVVLLLTLYVKKISFSSVSTKYRYLIVIQGAMYVPVIVNKLCNHAVIPRHLLNYAGCILNFAYNFSEMFSWREHVTMVVTSWLTCWDGE